MKCHAFIPCEKVIIDKDGAHSVINVMLNAEVSLQVAGPNHAAQESSIPPNAVVPSIWWLYSVWEPTEDDVGKNFEQVYQIYWPNGEKFIESRLSLTQKDDAMNQTTFYIAGFPVGIEGRVRLLTWLDSARGHRISEIYESFVNIKHRLNTSGRPEPLLAPA